jgi:hypothetical protein
MSNDPVVPSAGAALAARAAVERLAPGVATDEHAAARLAKAALFEEALLGAMRARIAELRGVAK